MSGATVGAVVGTVGALLFGVVNAFVLESPYPWYVIGAAVLAFALVLWLVLRVPPDPDAYRPDPRQLQAFWIVVALEVLAIIGGTQLAIRVINRPDLSLPWVAIVLGLHWLAFRLVFQQTVFLWLGWFTTTLGLLGAMIALTATGPPVSVPIVSGLFVGLVMFGCIGIDAYRRRQVLVSRKATPRRPGRSR